MKIVRFLTLAAAMTMTIVPHSTYAQAGGSHEQLEQMFANISQKTSWDMSKKMLLGYYFANPTREPLELASRELSEMGY